MTDMTQPQGHAAQPLGSLRERKKARTRASLREHALRLFRDQGYAATTVEQIAAAAEVSPSTFFRYFPTKEDVVLQDDFDTRLFEAFERQPPGLSPVAAVRAALRESVATLTAAEWEQFRETAAMSVAIPEIRARTLDEMTRMMSAMTEVIARRAGLPVTDLRVRTFAGAVLGIMMSVMMPHEEWAKGNPGPGSFNQVDEALALLEAGLPL
jgi:AcrR family transcriptional regulator